MYAVVNFSDDDKEQSLEVAVATDDIEYAKKAAFYYAKKELSEEKSTEKYIYKITSKIEDYENVYPKNKVIIAYRVIQLVKRKEGYKIESCSVNVYAVVEIKQIDTVDEIDSLLICDDYFS